MQRNKTNKSNKVANQSNDKATALKSRIERMRKRLIFWCLFIGVGAVFGASCMLIDPTGKLIMMDEMLPYFQVLPFADVLFQDYVFSGISLFIVNGLTQLITFVLIIRNKKCAYACGMGCGIILMLWICIQFYMFPLNFMSTIYFIFGLSEALTGYTLYRSQKIR